MQPPESGLPLLVCHKREADLLLTFKPDLRPIIRSRDLCVFSIDLNGEDLEFLSSFPDLRLSRYLDRYEVWAPDKDLAHRQKIFDSFFELIAESYDSLIDVNRNVENIANLLGFLGAILDPLAGSTIVDYGCGTGLSSRLTTSLGIDVIGVDRCPKMRKIALAKGMRVYSIGDLARQRRDSLDGAFASYVFHLLPHTEGLKLLWSRLKPGGVITANFHKNQGVELVEACLRGLGGSIVTIQNSVDSDRHGTYAAYRKD